MIRHWTSQTDYLDFLTAGIDALDPSQRKRLDGMTTTLEKMKLLDLDPVEELLLPCYSPIGRPAVHQMEILRSLILMPEMGYTGITAWVDALQHDELLDLLIGCRPYDLPPLGSYYDFITRLWLDPAPEKCGRKDLYSADRNCKPKGNKPGKGKKLEETKHPGICATMVENLQKGKDIPFNFEALLESILAEVGTKPSIEDGLIPDAAEGITLSGDGSCLHTHANPYGKKVCDCESKGIYDCNCPRHYSDIDAAWGWDSDLSVYYFGYNLYTETYHNSDLGVDLSLITRIINGRRHDSVSSIVCLHEFRKRCPDIRIANLCLDSASDNYPTYTLCKEWGINPFIDLNSQRGRPKSIPDAIKIDKDGTPICSGGLHMVYQGNDYKGHRVKWRCPVACGKADACPLSTPCSPSSYGRCVYTKPAWDIRLYTPVARGTDAWKKIYRNRTSCERMNNRILNDYRLHAMKIHGRKRASFFATVDGINIHLDARLKVRATAAAAG